MLPSSAPLIRAVLFDYGLVLTGPPLPAAWARMGRITGLEESDLHEAYWRFRHDYDRGMHTGSDYWRVATSHAGLTITDAQVEELIDSDTDLWTQPNQPMIDWALRLQTSGIRTGILSNLGDAMTAGVVARFPWIAAFDFCLWSHTLGLAKPEPAIYKAAAAGLQTEPSHILFIDDRPENIAGALSVGMQAIPYLNHNTFVAELERRGLAALWNIGPR